MHSIFYKGTAVMLGLFCLTSLPLHSAYSSADEIAVSLRAMDGGYIPQDNAHKIYISPEDARNGTTLHFGIFFETDPDTVDISYVSAVLQSESEFVNFTRTGFVSPSNYAYSTAQEFTHTDGNTYSSKFAPYCFGRINASGKYESACSSFMTNIRENELVSTWSYDYGNYNADGSQIFTAKFFGNTSDAYSFIEFNMEIAPDTPAGSYPVSFVSNEAMNNGSTYITSDDSIPDEENPTFYKSIYSNLIPAMHNAEIIVADANPQTETDIAPVFRYAHDETPFSIQDFPSDINLLYGGDILHMQTEDLLEIFEAGSPADIAVNEDEPVRILRSGLTFETMNVQNSQGSDAVLEYRIGLKGDADCNGTVNASDASLVLRYSASAGSGGDAFLTDGSDAVAEQFAFFLADIDGEGKEDSVLDASDASAILKYCASAGSGEEPVWNTVS